MQNFAKIFVRIWHFFTKINFPKGSENDAEFREKNQRQFFEILKEYGIFVKQKNAKFPKKKQNF